MNRDHFYHGNKRIGGRGMNRDHLLEIDPGKTYTMSGPPQKLLLFFDKQGQEIARVNVTDRGNKTYSFSVPKDCVGIKFEDWVKSYDSL